MWPEQCGGQAACEGHRFSLRESPESWDEQRKTFQRRMSLGWTRGIPGTRLKRMEKTVEHGVNSNVNYGLG